MSKNNGFTFTIVGATPMQLALRMVPFCISNLKMKLMKLNLEGAPGVAGVAWQKCRYKFSFRPKLRKNHVVGATHRTVDCTV